MLWRWSEVVEERHEGVGRAVASRAGAGLLDAGEGLFLYAKIEPHLKEFRKQFSPTAFTNSEWIVKKSPVAQQRMKLWRKRIAAMTAEKAQA